MADYKFDTLSLHAGQSPDGRFGSRAVPIHQTTSYVFQDTEQAAALFNMEIGGHIYTRLTNPTVAVLEQRLAALDGGVAAVATASGMSALFVTVLAICSAGDHVVASSQMYGANINLFQHTLSRYGIETTFVKPRADEIEGAIRENTKMVFGEVIGNPGMDIMDVPAVAAVTKAANVPLVIDATFNTPWMVKPIEMGANIVIHSLTKWMGGHGVALGGGVIDGGNFDWGATPGKFPTMTEAHFGYQGVNLWEEFGPMAFATRVRTEGMMNAGPCMAPQNAFYILQGIETLPLRMERHMSNTAKMLEFLTNHEQVSWVKHPALSDHPDHETALRLMPKGQGSIISMGVKGGRAAASAFIENVGLASHLANVGDAKTLVIHPGSTTHSHITADAMEAAGLTDDLVRISVGLEDFDDIAADFTQALRAAGRAAPKVAAE
ncbi:MAG: PLP-dependent transferase [Pseudomonadota bacterium]